MSLPRPDHRTRKHLATWLVGVLLLAQWLVAAYACPPAGSAGGVPHVAVAVAVAVQGSVEVPPCHAADGFSQASATANLCQAHCGADAQLPGVVAAADLPLPSLGWCLVAGALLLPCDAGAAVATGAALAGAPPVWPPLFLTHRVLRN